jgi:orotate phosphoribosyltransferase
MSQVEGHAPPGAQVGLIEDVSTTGTQVLRAARALEAAGCQIGIVVLAIDRGGGTRLREAGYWVKAVVDVDAGDGDGPAGDEGGD